MLILPEYMAEALGVMELSLIIGPIDQSYLSVSNLLYELHRVLIDYHKSVIGAVRNDDQVVLQSSLLLNTQDLAWVSQVLLTS